MARIHLDNYEAFLMDYVDSIVHQKEDMQLKQEIECFLNQHPSLREDFELVLAFSLHEKELLEVSLPTEKEYYADKEKLKSIAQSKAKERKLFRPIFYWAAACFLVLGLSVFVLRLYKGEEAKIPSKKQSYLTQEVPDQNERKISEQKILKEEKIEKKINTKEYYAESKKEKSHEEVKSEPLKNAPEYTFEREESLLIATIEKRLPYVSTKSVNLLVLADTKPSIPATKKQNSYLKEVNEYISASINQEKNSLKHAFRHFFGSASRKYHRKKVEIENHFPALFKSNDYYAFWEEKKENNK